MHRSDFNKQEKSIQTATTVETGPSDFHTMVVSVVKSKYQKEGLSIINYRNYKDFKLEEFSKDLRLEINKLQANKTDILSYRQFEEAVNEVIDKHAPKKKNFLRANHAPFMTKSLRKAIMLCSQLRNRCNKSRTSEKINSYLKKRNLCVKLLKSAKKDYYNNLTINHVTDNKKFWKTVNPAFSDKPRQSKKIVLVDNDDIIFNDTDIAETFNKVFVMIAESFSIRETPKNQLRPRVYLTLSLQQSISSLITLEL